MIKALSRSKPEDSQADQPGHALVGVVNMPGPRVSPGLAIVRRFAIALSALLTMVFVVYFDRDGYSDVNGDGVSLVDAFYYATVSLSTTGYGDIAPVTDTARLLNVVLITPLRVLFLIVLIGTTLEVLTERSRQALRIQKWRRTVRDHVVVVGFGTKGRSAVNAMLAEDEADSNQVVVVDTNQESLDAANALGLITVHGSATRSDVLRVAGVQRARSIVIAPNRDDTAVLVALTAREMAPKAHILASVREAENVHLLKQSGADQVVVSSETAGRLLGIATRTPLVVDMVEDLLTPQTGMAIAERPVEESEVGGSPRHLADIVLGVVRDGTLYRVDAPAADALERGDHLLYVRKATPGEEALR